MATADTYTITLHDPRKDTDEEIAERVEYLNRQSEEVLPGEPPWPVEVAIASTRATPERLKLWSFRAWADGSMVGHADVGFDLENDTNPDLMGCGVQVDAAHRRNGLGSRLFGELVKVARAEDRTRIVSDTNERIPGGAAFAEAVGATSKQDMHMNRLLIEDVDRPMLEQWVADGPVRAEGYELIAWDGAVRDEWLDQYVKTFLVMNTAPHDDLERNDFTFSPAEARERDEQLAAAGTEQWTIVARRISDGSWAGFHDVYWAPHDGNVVYVGATGVDPEHRGHALGKWLKAAMTLRIMDERPQVTEIRTGNADSNDAMLGINKQMGYKPFIAQRLWEISTNDAEAWLRTRGVLTD
jgi:GNAT superfamily N-acetyltransferase